MKPEIMWMITGKYGFYSGAQFTRKDMINEHVTMTGIPWRKCYRNGDRAVKVEIRRVS